MQDLEGGSEPPVVVLLVEDEALIRMVSADTLIDAGYRVIEASNADEALSLLEARGDVRVLVTDVAMPGKLDGFALARLVGRRWPHIGIIITSGHAVRGDAQVPVGTLFLSKPYRAQALLGRMRALTAQVDGEPVITPDAAVLVPDASAVSEALSPTAAETAKPKLEKDGEAET